MKDYARLTIDMTQEEHTFLKMASAQLGISMRKFMLLSAFQMMKGLEDEWLAGKAQEAIERLTPEKAPSPSIISPQEQDLSLT
ncbi:MAG: hypothetical protein Q8L98_06670 [Chlamydiales bacterium]|nr:hypothetical protein [Chlamydiales bacterium]